MQKQNAPWILGLAYSHNGSACLLRGDEIVVAVQEERLLRQKRASLSGGWGSLAVTYCLETAGIRPEDLSAAVICPTTESQSVEADLALNGRLRLVRNKVPIFTIAHHFGHALSAFATSGFEDAAVLVVDGSGSSWDELPPEERAVVKGTDEASVREAMARGLRVREWASLYMASGTSIRPLEKHVLELIGPEALHEQRRTGMREFRGLGHLYQGIGWQLFGSEDEGPGKVMGLSPFGQPTTPPSDFYELVDGAFRFKDTVPARYRHHDRWPAREQEYADLAASAQHAVEEALLHLARRARALSGSTRLCYSGGVALNSIANERLHRESGFEQLSVMPAAEDSGTAVGAAYYGLWQLTGRNTRRKLHHDAVGKVYASAEVRSAAQAQAGLREIRCDDTLQKAVDLLVDGKIIGWFEGRSELGPRALGQRSILCDPRRAEMKDVLNQKVKFREGFRPFAPILPLENAAEWFELDGVSKESPFMLRIAKFRQEKRALVPAVVHVDGTGRLQTLTAENNGRLYQLAKLFEQRTGCPVLLNTSFNIAGEPIVETPDDALWCLLFTGLDAVVFESAIFGKDPGFRSVLDLEIRITADTFSMEFPITQGVLPTELGEVAGDIPIPVPFGTHLDGVAMIDAHPLARMFPHVRFRTSTPWGRTLQLFKPEVATVLKRVGPGTTGRKLLEALQPEGFDERRLTRLLGVLRRARVISIGQLDSKTSQS
ncbi:carbamoyltransferase family protein [Hyalangium gracile]|uniref:carbamoyltransferase family protein n=1 Tax=Hyalangium gracile TaxID=394092 RepID=UPI001CCFB373|nr:carbamoyltransferase C-terminal domain-containing protein [Hyalangium gracile]